MLNLDRLTRTSILRHLYKQMGCEVNAKYNCIFTEDRILLTTYTRTKSWHFLKQTTAKTLSKKKDIEISVVPTYVQTTTHCYTTRNKICDTQSIVYNYWFFFSFFFFRLDVISIGSVLDFTTLISQRAISFFFSKIKSLTSFINWSKITVIICTHCESIRNE